MILRMSTIEGAIGTVGGEDRPEPVSRERKSRPVCAGRDVNVTPFGERIVSAPGFAPIRK
jgi:hypothetical protein